MIQVEGKALDEVAPFALVVAEDGQLLHVGRSIRKTLAFDAETQPADFFDLFRITKPRTLCDTQDLGEACGKRITLEASREGTDGVIAFRADIARTDPEGRAFLVMVSLGLELPNLVDSLGLSDRDFTHADPSIDLLYLLKSQSSLLQDAHELADRLRQAKESAEAQALTDPLTGLPNRRALGAFANTLLAKVNRDGTRAHLLHIDLDRFKQVNDSLGHAAGDAILKRVTDDLRAACSAGDFAARIGGDEFVLILKEREHFDDILSLAGTLIATISAPLEIEDQQASVGASIGITTIHPDVTKSIDTYLLEADLALYDVKNAGRGAVKVYAGELKDREEFTRALIRDIDPAIAHGEFEPFFQVQVDTLTGNVFGAEVLGRWRHPEHGLITPGRFLYVAERAKLTEKIDTAIYLKALDHLAAWKAEGIAPPHISLNLTERLLTQPRFIPWITREVARRGIAPGEIIFELVEAILLDGESDTICDHAAELNKQGFGLAIDDFGTGRASVTSLISIPVNLVKIDRAFVSGIHKDKKRALLAEAIINVSNQLGLKTLAEGAEVEEECRAVRDLGCHVFQGYLFGKPVPATEFTESLRDSEWMAVEASAAGSGKAANSADDGRVVKKAG